MCIPVCHFAGYGNTFLSLCRVWQYPSVILQAMCIPFCLSAGYDNTFLLLYRLCVYPSVTLQGMTIPFCYFTCYVYTLLSLYRVCVYPFVTLQGMCIPFCHFTGYVCNGVEWSKDKTQAAESIKWRPQQAYGSNQFLLVQPQTVFSTHTKSSRSRIDKRTARATGNTRYRYSKIAPLDHKMADNCVSLARTNTVSSTITKPIKT